ncbi:MAG: apolipoprotein N-acyltransferase [Alphaproteobacteria bacterium]|nr:apolipoprotein N-acyltransferase [Alphaproteobacteria bacterium]
MQVYVNFEDKRWKKYDIDFNRIATAAGPKRHGVEVSITLTNDKEIHKLNKKYRNIDRPTNVLSFELGDDLLLGDIYISLDTVAREAADAGISIPEHVAHMVVHGMLHLQGYDHIQDDEAVIMETKEIAIMKKLGYKNPYADDECGCGCVNCDCKNCACHHCPGDKTISFFKKIKIRENGFWQYALYALFGGVAAFGFAPFYMWWATVLGVGGAYWLTVRRKNYGGIIHEMLRLAPFGIMYAIAMLWWTLNSIYVVPELTKQFAIWTVPALIGIGLFGALFFVWPYVAITQGKMTAAQRVFMFSGVWTIILWLREWIFTGFPWNPIANIMLPFPSVANSMSVWGALGLTFVITGAIASTLELLRNNKNVKNWIVFLFFVITFVCGGILGIHNMNVAENDTESSVKIRIVQPAQTQSQKMIYSRTDALKRAEDILLDLFKMAASGDEADLIVFPETTYPYTITNNDDMPLAQALKTNVIIGANYFDGAKVYNSMIVASKNGNISNIYSKSHLVPFGEYRPMGFLPAPANLAHGGGAELISVNAGDDDFVFAPAICYEILFTDSLVPESVLAPNAIINITNDTWFGKTPGTYQHLDMVRRYAIESGLPVIRANYSGISAFVLSNGEVLSSLPIGQSGIIDGTVWGAHKTFYRTIGRNGMMIIILLIACIGVISTRDRPKKD